MTADNVPGLRAVFITDLSFMAAHVIASWLQAGHRVMACVQSNRPRKSQWRRDRLRGVFAPLFSVQQLCRKHRIPILIAPRDLKEQAFAARLRALDADVLISLGFQHRISAEMTSAFRHGGVNLHPALLPDYRGPQPVAAMAVDATLQRCAGVSLHCVVDGFDEGHIIAQQAATNDDLRQPEWHQIWFARIAADLIVRHLPDFCVGRVQPRPQAEGEWRYARLAPEDWIITSAMDLASLQRRARVLGPLGKLRLALGEESYAIAGFKKSAAPTAEPPRVSWRTIAFDAADGRIWLIRSGRLQRRLRTMEEFRQLHRLAKKEGGETL